MSDIGGRERSEGSSTSATLPSVALSIRLQRIIGAGLVLAFSSLPATADGPILHEFIPPDPHEDLLLEATTVGGRLPAAIETPSGAVPAPETRRAPADTEVAYGGASTPTSSDASYRIDRLTTQPDSVSYHDPFLPSIAPFKRLYAYDTVDASLRLQVADSTLTRITTRGEPKLGEDQFYGDLVVDLVPNVPVRIPTVGPGARVLAATINPPLPYELVRDGADNWFIRSSSRRRVRLTLQLAIDRRVFGAPYTHVTYATLAAHVPALPPIAAESGRRVLASLGISRAMRPPEAVQALVAHFRSFTPSADLPEASLGTGLYEELSLSQKGVCRHRAYAFVITALTLGIPARMVRNEAHAWVEVYDAEVWHRIDLGGAAGAMNISRAEEASQYRLPPDPYDWPEGSQSGTELVEEALSAQGGAGRQRKPQPSPMPVEESDPSGVEPPKFSTLARRTGLGLRLCWSMFASAARNCHEKDCRAGLCSRASASDCCSAIGVLGSAGRSSADAARSSSVYAGA